MEEAERTFEEQWGDAFEKAEQTPPAHIWTAIDGQLANQEAEKYKKRLLFYQWSAAACVGLLALLGVGYWATTPSTDDPNNRNLIEANSIQNESKATEATITSTEKSIFPDSKNLENNESPASSVPALEAVKKKNLSGSTPKENLEQVIPIIDQQEPNSEVKAGYRTRTAEPYLIAQLDGKEVDYEAAIDKPELPYHLYGVPNTAYIEDKEEQQLWAGVSMNSGSFNPAFGSGNQSDMMMASDPTSELTFNQSNTVNNEELDYDPGYSISAGLNVGTRVGKKIILSTGLHYQAFNTDDAQTGLVSQNGDYFALTGSRTDEAFNTAADSEALEAAGNVSLSNEYQYITVPIKAGYVLLDRKFNIVFNTGLASNFLMNAQLESHGSQSLSNDLDTSNDYESVYFNFSTGLEFGYRFFRNYQVTLEPNYNQALTDFTNSNHSSQGKPRSVGLAFGLKYIF
ncbi:outer membrane beta-barrel protein [Reichenbachiella ulvae]|uniref:Outer membrane beta-barrel protein n=1 Tax=Reichenbachiella ulvae TaxID=2980104 RepID=A0ABT3CYK4_9BACT|nr:outer membrane beta-barrel protein [Reichenbachiella ulvae]MCV9388702.1 outer membrane beta-barrel protein [Reichenbachiella ulvae]